MARPEFVPHSDATSALAGDYDAVVLVAPSQHCGHAPIDDALHAAAALDATVGDAVLLVPARVPGGRLIFAPTGRLDRDWDDVRPFGDAARAGVSRARDAGATRPLVLLAGVPDSDAFDRATEVALLGACAGLWEPLEAREHDPGCEPVTHLGFVGDSATARLVGALEHGKRLSRDLGGTNPERMRPELFAEYCVNAFEGTPVQVEVKGNQDALEREYPMLMAVSRATRPVPRYHARVVRLVLEPEDEVTRTVLVAGKGVTYDTGGSDLKTGGHMAGMSRDKGGAASAAGLMRSLAELRPEGLRVVVELGLVRNAIGSEAFVTDEIITSHAGVRVRIGNTDAEGRLVLGDLLSHLREDALEAVEPRMFTVATLTGHSLIAMGPYSIALDNGPARAEGVADGIDACGEAWGDCFEVSRLRREDVAFVKPHSKADDVLSCNNAPSSGTPRGHQFPAAFLMKASGLMEHGGDSDRPLAFTHVDIGGSYCEGMDWQHGRPTAAPVVALTAWAAGLG